MEPEDARIEDVRAWLCKAELDLRAAVHDLSAPEERLWGDVMFHEEAGPALAAAQSLYEAILARVPREAQP